MRRWRSCQLYQANPVTWTYLCRNIIFTNIAAWVEALLVALHVIQSAIVARGKSTTRRQAGIAASTPKAVNSFCTVLFVTILSPGSCNFHAFCKVSHMVHQEH